MNDGFPSRTQSCIDGDPACDQDGATDGKCVFQVAACTRVTDARLPGLQPAQIESISINKPNVLGADGSGRRGERTALAGRDGGASA